MGDYYYSGYYVQKDYEKAKGYYEKAGSKGLSQGLINIGLMY
jgi:TPR repeat protein